MTDAEKKLRIISCTTTAKPRLTHNILKKLSFTLKSDWLTFVLEKMILALAVFVLCCVYTCIHIYGKFGFCFSLTMVAFTTLTINYQN